MSQELHILGLAVVGASCWWLGGRGTLPFRKAWRREVWPLSVALVAWAHGASWMVLVVGTGAMIGAHHLGYGEDDPLWKRVVTGLALGVCLIPFGVAWWQAFLVSGWFALNYLLSLFSNRHTWAFVETTTGAIQGGLLGMVV